MPVYSAARAIKPAPTAPPIAQGAFEMCVAPAVLEDVLVEDVEALAVTVADAKLMVNP